MIKLYLDKFIVSFWEFGPRTLGIVDISSEIVNIYRKSVSDKKSSADAWHSIEMLPAGRTMIDLSQKSEVIGSSPMDVKNSSASLNIFSGV